MSVLSKEQVAALKAAGRNMYGDESQDLCDSHEQLRAEVERLTVERDEAQEAVARACEVVYVQERRRAEAAEAEVERLVGRIAYEAEQYRDYQRECGRSVNDWGPHDAALREICDAYRAAQPKGGSDDEQR